MKLTKSDLKNLALFIFTFYIVKVIVVFLSVEILKYLTQWKVKIFIKQQLGSGLVDILCCITQQTEQFNVRQVEGGIIVIHQKCTVVI